MGVSGQTDVSAVGVGLLGLGVVGSAVAKALLSRDEESKERKIPLALVSAVVRDPNKNDRLTLINRYYRMIHKP